MYEQATIPVASPQAFTRVQAGVQSTFAQGRAGKFLKAVAGRGCRVRDFEALLEKGLLGTGAQADYASLPDSDKAQVRELYLSLAEKVDPELRRKFMKVYTYY